MKRFRKSTVITVALLIYITAVSIYLVPRNTEMDSTEKIVTVAASYVIVLVLWLVLRKKEKMQQRHRDE